MSCEKFEDIRECANDEAFCRNSCQLAVCSPKMFPTSQFIVSKDASDSSILRKCNTTEAGRYDLHLGENQEDVPALIIFILTILSFLLAIFVIIVLQYNCIVHFGGKIPYKIPCLKCCRSRCELYFPYCISEKHMKEKMLKDEEKRKKTDDR